MNIPPRPTAVDILRTHLERAAETAASVLADQNVLRDGLVMMEEATEELDAVIDNVRALHRPADLSMTAPTGDRYCVECTGDNDAAPRPWPCATVRALDTDPDLRSITLPNRDDILALLPDTIPGPEHVEDWPADERDYFREGDWSDFTERRQRIQDMRKAKLADALIAVLPHRNCRPGQAAAWQAGVDTALDHAIRNEDGVTLRLEHLGGTPWRNPYDVMTDAEAQ